MYVNKVSDEATFTLENEWYKISKYEVGRYISSSKVFREISAFQFMIDFPKLYIFLFTLKTVKEFASILQLIMPQLG